MMQRDPFERDEYEGPSIFIPTPCITACGQIAFEGARVAGPDGLTGEIVALDSAGQALVAVDGGGTRRLTGQQIILR